MTRNNLQILVKFTPLGAPLGEDLHCKMRRLHLEFCFIYVDRLTCCLFRYSYALSKLFPAHYKTHFGLLRVMTMSKSSWDTKPDLFTDSSMLYGGLGGYRPRVQNIFYFTSYSNIKFQFGFEPCSSLVDLRFPQC